MKPSLLPLLFSFLALLALTGCPPDTEVGPAFVTLEGFDLQVPGQEGITSDISEVWAFLDNEFIGAFPLPARIPILSAGPAELRLEAGVKQDGVSTTPDIYPFYTPVIRTVELVSGQTTALGTPTIGYKSGVNFAIFEDFELASVRGFPVQVVGDTLLERTQEQVRTGAFSGRIYLSAAKPVVEVATAEIYRNLLDNQQPVWLELDFLSAGIGRIGVSGARGVEIVREFGPGFRDRNEWTKIYFNLTQIIFDANLEEYRFNISTLLPDGLDQGSVYLDNIKLLHF